MTAPIPAPSSPPARADEIAAALNRGCRCVTLDEPALARGLAEAVDDPGVLAEIRRDRPHLFSATAVFAAPADIARMRAVIDAVERVVALPAYRERALAWAPPSARFDPGTRGVFLGYDFHLGPDGPKPQAGHPWPAALASATAPGVALPPASMQSSVPSPKLIEINTNAGGPLLNMLLARASSACCREARDAMAGPMATGRLEEIFVEMFRAEWRLARGDAPLKTIAIVDDRPEQQYLHPEFRLFETLFRRHGFEAVIADAADLMVCHGNLWHSETRIDLVYNRLTDFALADPAHTALREAYLNNTAVVTPHPRAHALYADKRNLCLLTDETFLRSLGLPAETVATLLGGIPRTIAVTPAQAEEFWSTRKQWFFKPAAGYGSKAAYRGDKLTKRVFAEILQGDYVAQAQADPGERHAPAVEQALKFDIRNYVYDGRVQLLAARLYQGQTTNFRTAGGGFAPVFCAPSAACAG